MQASASKTILRISRSFGGAAYERTGEFFHFFLKCFPPNQIWYIMDRYQQIQMERKDVRVNLVNEILNGIKVINKSIYYFYLHFKVLKMYAWEKPFIEMIGDIRKAEIDALKKFQYLEGTQVLELMLIS